MKQIGFRNFRRFQNFPLLEMGDVTFLVGANNAGKSTVAKAMLLIRENLLNLSDEIELVESPEFDFAPSSIHDYIHIGTFGRALYSNAENDTIELNAHIGDFSISIIISGDRKTSRSSSKINSIEVYDHDTGITILHNYVDKTIEFLYQQKRVYDKVDLYELFTKTPKIIKAIDRLGLPKPEKFSDIDTIISTFEDDTRDEIQEEIQFLRKLKEDHEADIQKLVTNQIDFSHGYSVKKSFKELKKIRTYGFNFFSRMFNVMREGINNNGDVKSEDNVGSQFLTEQLFVLQEVSYRLWRDLRKHDIVYIYAHAVSQSTLYRINAQNDYMSKTIQDFYNLNLTSKDNILTFVESWMKKFNIGSSFNINPIEGGEAYTFRLKDVNGNNMNLADKGMGAIQLMILLLKMAYLIVKLRGQKGSTIIVEEPEQNLHPKFQSMLADMFFEISKSHKIRFVIETHSEYLIRSSQVRVASLDCKTDDDLQKKNPFKVYYFPEDDIPYPMKYQIDGKFANKFKEGFFDEAKRQISLLY